LLLADPRDLIKGFVIAFLQTVVDSDHNNFGINVQYILTVLYEFHEPRTKLDNRI